MERDQRSRARSPKYRIGWPEAKQKKRKQRSKKQEKKRRKKTSAERDAGESGGGSNNSVAKAATSGQTKEKLKDRDSDKVVDAVKKRKKEGITRKRN